MRLFEFGHALTWLMPPEEIIPVGIGDVTPLNDYPAGVPLRSLLRLRLPVLDLAYSDPAYVAVGCY